MRVTLTFDAIHSAERVWLVTAGDSKAEAVSKAFDEDTPWRRSLEERSRHR
ncbi:6-phosphogluconolactonase [Nesterenkonia pannonica]|uniref:6-phosphogluconolactonase n=1 Tax=Nesterenkonia pannonica TaxID=1548602 RepID=UPI002164CB02|nr:6-phosphogluconolactonase [Nesterenkonia pannonica]